MRMVKAADDVTRKRGQHFFQCHAFAETGDYFRIFKLSQQEMPMLQPVANAALRTIIAHI